MCSRVRSSQRGRDRCDEEIRVTGADGLVRWLEIKAETVFTDGTAAGLDAATAHGRAVRVSGVATDITDRKHREADLALLDQIADGCARLSSPEEIMQAVGPLLGSYLDLPTVCLLSVDEPHDQFRMLHMWNREGSPIRPDVIRISDFVTPEYRQAARSGAPLVVHDTHGDPLTYASAHAVLQVRAFMSVPFIRDGEWKFIFSVCDVRPHGWRDEEVSLFRQLADRLFARLEQALAEQAVANDLRDTQLLRDLSVRLVSESDTQAFFEAIVAAAKSITGAQAGCLQLLDAVAHDLVLLASSGFEPAAAQRLSRVNSKSPVSCGQALAMNRPAVVHYDVPGITDPDGTIRLLVEGGLRSAQSTPLVTRAGRTVGMLCTKWTESQRRPSIRETRFLDLLARQAAEFIERRLSDNALRESERQLSIELADTKLLQHLSAQLIEEQGTASLYETLVDAALWIMRSDYASMQVLHPERGPRGALRLIAARGFDEAATQRFQWVSADDATTCARALQTSARVITPNVARCDFMAGTASQAALLETGIQASQTTPLVSRAGKTVGMISTHWRQSHHPSERDLRLLDILARQAADLIERTHAEEALRDSERQLKETDRRKDEFLATLAHELRNPLAPLRTSLELIRIAGNTPESIEEVREDMQEQLALLVRLVDDLLDVSRIRSGKIRLQRLPMELATLVARAVRANRGAIDQRQIHLSIDLPETRVLIDSDPVRFVQVVSNVVQQCGEVHRPGRTRQHLRRSGVTGHRAERGRPPHRGLGGGHLQCDVAPCLRPVHAGRRHGVPIADRSGHRAGARSTSDRDARRIRSTLTATAPTGAAPLPCECPWRRSPQRFTPSPRPRWRRVHGRRVLVIDDNPAGARAMKRLVTALGGECRVAHNGQAGLADIRESRPDIVILDIGMPGLDGYETCRRIREEFGSSLMVVALTGWGQERDKDKAMQAGFDLHLTKPADPTLLEELLTTASIERAARV